MACSFGVYRQPRAAVRAATLLHGASMRALLCGLAACRYASQGEALALRLPEAKYAVLYGLCTSKKKELLQGGDVRLLAFFWAY